MVDRKVYSFFLTDVLRYTRASSLPSSFSGTKSTQDLLTVETTNVASIETTGRTLASALAALESAFLPNTSMAGNCSLNQLPCNPVHDRQVAEAHQGLCLPWQFVEEMSWSAVEARDSL